METENQREQQARQRLRLVLEVQAGCRSATEAARELGISRQAFHQWEKRGLHALLQAMEEQPAGRPAAEEDPRRELREENLQLRHRLAVTEEVAELRAALLRQLAEEERSGVPAIKKKRRGSAKSSSEPNA